MNIIYNIENIPEEYIDDPGFQSQLKTAALGDAAGSEKIYVNVDFVKPGGKSTKYHAHSRQEEFFLILSGTGILRMNGEEAIVRKGDMIAKPAGKNIAHQFINNGSEILQILDVGTRESDDIITYPDENEIYIKDKKLTFSMDKSIPNWSSDPNR